MAVPNWTSVDDWPGQSRSRNGWESDWAGVIESLEAGQTVALTVPETANPEHYRSAVSGSFRTHGIAIETTLREGLLYIRKQVSSGTRKRRAKAVS